jgi:streptomycin 6-kinase
MSAVIAVPAVVRAKAILVGAADWLDQLPALVSAVEREWGLTVGACYDDATEGFVAQARLVDGSLAVLKLVMPHDSDAAVHEITALRLARGQGCAALLRDDAERGALLVEHLGRSLHQLGLPVRTRHEILCATAQQVWRPAAGSGLPSGAEKGRWLVDFIARTWEELDRPCSERAVTDALTCAAHRIGCHDDERAVLVHGDVHQWNTLESSGGFKLVDPDGLFAEAEYDLGVMMREDPLDLLHGDPRQRARWLAAETGLDATAIWEWGVVERVSTGLLCTSIGLQPVGREMLAVADRAAQ